MKINNQMKINRINKAYGKNVGKVKKTEKSEFKKDKIEISEEAKSFQVAMNAINKLPEARQDKVDELKKQIEEGTYKPSAKEIAKRMLQHAANIDKG